MYSLHPAAQAFKRLGVFDKPTPVLDSAAEAEKKQAVLDAAGSAELADIRASAAATVQAWAATPASDLDEGETMADRLLAMFVGIADANMDGELTEDEADLVQIAMDAAFDYLASKGVSDADASALLNDGDNEAAARIAELIAGEAPADDVAAADDIDGFAFDADSQASLLDSAVFDAVYKKKLVVRGGRKVRINKRVSGHVRLSAAQKVAIRKAGMKSHSAAARMKRLKSTNLRAKFGLK